jgi:hypothetical protein
VIRHLAYWSAVVGALVAGCYGAVRSGRDTAAIVTMRYGVCEGCGDEGLLHRVGRRFLCPLCEMGAER